MLKLTFFLVFFIWYHNVEGNDYPGKLFREEWGNQLMGTHLINLTMTMCKDALLKLRMADRVQQTYKYSFTYELGLLASGITDKFKRMLKIYRFYSAHTDFKAEKHSSLENIDELMNAYQGLQSDYNEIRAERDLFLDVMHYHSKKKSKKDLFLEEYAKKHPGIDINMVKQKMKEQGLTMGAFERRSMSNNTWNGTDASTTEDSVMEELMAIENNDQKLTSRKVNNTEWNNLVPKDEQEQEYKKKLRYLMWAERWKGYNPETEGINVPDFIVKAGLSNQSSFLERDFKGDFI